MDLCEAIETRQSIRAYKPDPVPRKVLVQIMTKALRSPSWGNTQTWGFNIVSGQALENIKNENYECAKKGVDPSPELVMPSEWTEDQGARYKDLGKGLFASLGIERGDVERRGEHYLVMSRFFDAPHIIYFHLDKAFNHYALLDGGLILQTIALLAVDQGLGTCFLAMSVVNPQVVRKYARIPDDRTIVMGLSIGYPVPGHAANLFRSERGSLDEFLTWVDD